MLPKRMAMIVKMLMIAMVVRMVMGMEMMLSDPPSGPPRSTGALLVSLFLSTTPHCCPLCVLLHCPTNHCNALSAPHKYNSCVQHTHYTTCYASELSYTKMQGTSICEVLHPNISVQYNAMQCTAIQCTGFNIAQL